LQFGAGKRHQLGFGHKRTRPTANVQPADLKLGFDRGPTLGLMGPAQVGPALAGHLRLAQIDELSQLGGQLVQVECGRYGGFFQIAGPSHLQEIRQTQQVVQHQR